MRVTLEMLKPGMIVYHVYCFPDRELKGSINQERLSSEPFAHEKNDAVPDWLFAHFVSNGCFKRTREGGYELLGPEFKSSRFGSSLKDMGIVPNYYNKHATFTTFDSAWGYFQQTNGLYDPKPKEPEWGAT